jgi:hypothetical protein
MLGSNCKAAKVLELRALSRLSAALKSSGREVISLYGTVTEPEIIPYRVPGKGYSPCTYKGEWVRYDVHKLLRDEERLQGIGQVKFAWVYDALIVDIHSTIHGEISAFLYEDSKYRRAEIERGRMDRLWRVQEPLVLREGVGL